MSLLRECGTSKLLRQCGTATLLRDCVCLCADSPALTHVSPDEGAVFLCGQDVTLVAERSAGNPPCGMAVFEVFKGDVLTNVGYAPFVAGVATYVFPAGVVCPENSYEWRAGIEVDGVRCAYSSKRGFSTDVYPSTDGWPEYITVTEASANALKAYIEAAYPGELLVYFWSRTLSLHSTGLVDYRDGYAVQIEVCVGDICYPQYYPDIGLYQSIGCFWRTDGGGWVQPDQWICAPPASGTKFLPLWLPFYGDYPDALPPENDTSAWLEIE